MSKNKTKTQNINLENIEKLLNQQTLVILSAVDKKINELEEKVNTRIDKLGVEIS